MKTKQQIERFTAVILLIIVIIFGFIISPNRIKCEGEATHPDLYYFKEYKSNLSNSRYNCVIRSHFADRLAAEKKRRQQQQFDMLQQQRKECYEQGQFYNLSFDLRADYNFTCEEIDYINSHLIIRSERKDGGSIKAEYRGFLSSHTVDTKLYDWVNTHNLATGKLIKTAYFHLDCNRETLHWRTTNICQNGFPIDVVFRRGESCWNPREGRLETKHTTYYSEEDFVMYYVNHCIGG